ncbi:MAG: aminopeptidase P family protein [Acidobacteria bacterium]|nr:MAG: aminopeptidase P family protein [Acidobacteriota bacterium]
MIKDRLRKLRSLMAENGVQAYIVPSTDPHQSEYVPAFWRRREWISGFTGSAGDVVVTMDKAGLWTDSRYFLQAEDQLEGSGITLFKQGVSGTPSIVSWITDQLSSGERVGVDARLFTSGEFSAMAETWAMSGIGLISLSENLVDLIWADRPDVPSEPVRVHPVEFSGESVADKLEKIRRELKLRRMDAHVVTMLDAIAWLYNVRGSDVEYNPVVIAYAIVTMDSAMLFVHGEKVGESLRSHLAGQVNINEYEAFADALGELADGGGRILLDSGSASQWVTEQLEGNCSVEMGTSPITLLKAVKNEVELEGFKKAHVRDGVAMVRFLNWLEKAVPAGGVTEISAADKLAGFRAENEHFTGLSFETISSYGPHGAIIHYGPTPETDVELKPDGIYLVDSGGQYLDGTTDITRTVTLGNPTKKQKELFTRVLKGHIDLGMCRFPVGTVGKQLDTIARLPLWEVGLNYGHGTGHGVGSYLNVHEGPHAISYYRCIGVPFMPGMVTSNEPGFYLAGEFGIRIENLVYVVQDETAPDKELPFNRFENLTVCPIDTRLVEQSLLTDAELDYLNRYHRFVFDSLSPLLSGDDLEWLRKATKKL